MRHKQVLFLTSFLAVFGCLAFVLTACTAQPPALPLPATQVIASPAGETTPPPANPNGVPPTVEGNPSPESTPTLQPTPTLVPTTPVPTILPTETPTPGPSPTPTVPEEPLAGVELHNISQKGGLSLMVDGLHWVRRNALLWSAVEPQEGMRAWNNQKSLEKELKNASAQGLQTILIIRDAPFWAQAYPSISCGPVAREKLAAFAAFVRDAVARYSEAPYNIQYFELGNEPDIDRAFVAPDNMFGCWGDSTDPNYGGGYYAEMLRAVYPEAKAANEQAQILIGGLLLDCNPANPPQLADGTLKDCTAGRFLEGILQAGGGDYFDGVSFHAYDYYSGELGKYGNANWKSDSTSTGPVLTDKAQFLRGVLAQYGYSDKYLLNTEVALICGQTGLEDVCMADDFQHSKAIYAAQVSAAAAVAGLKANVWYSITGWRASALVNSGLDPYPVYNALRFASMQFNRVVLVRELDEFPGVKGYEFNRDGSRFWLLWSLDGSPHSIRLPGKPLQAYDLFGDSLAASQGVEIAADPIYFVWGQESNTGN